MRPLLLLLFVSSLAVAAEPLPRSTPEEQGVSSHAIEATIEELDRRFDSVHSFMLVRHGNVVAEAWWAPYRAESPHMLFSLSKSFTSTAVGMAVADGKLSVDDEVLKKFPEFAPDAPSDQLKAMRVRDLLRMATGHVNEPPRPPDVPWAKAFLHHPVPFKPGTHFQYNTPATYMQAALVERATGQSLVDYLRPRLFEPLGIDNPQWERCPQGVCTGGFGLKVRTEDIAKFGQLYLQQGEWNGRRLISPEWIADATTRQVANGSNPASDWDQGYGYQFWRCRHGAYRGDGAFGQYCVVLPEQDAVLAITSGLGDMQGVLNVVWEELLPGFSEGPLDENKAVVGLRALEASRKIRPVDGVGKSEFLGKKIVLGPNDAKWESCTLSPGEAEGDTILTAKIAGAEHRVVCRAGAWHPDTFAWAKIGASPTAAEGPVAATGAWASPEKFVAKLCFYETPFIATTTIEFKDAEATVTTQMNLGFGGTQPLKVVGKVE